MTRAVWLRWIAVCAICAVPVGLAAFSPFLQWRSAVYIAAGFAGIAALALLLIQPLLITGALALPGPRAARRVHGWIGATLLGLVAVHIAGLWITSPPDVIDVLLLRSPTPFGLWGALAMWAALAAGLLAGMRRRIALRPRLWRALHLGAASVLAVSTTLHAVLIEGAMERWSKWALCALVLAATATLIYRIWARK